MDNQLMQEIDSYWTNRASGYSKVNQEELAGMQQRRWFAVIDQKIKEQFGAKAPEEIKILDVGTGPGFFAIILAKAGYQVTAVDYTEAMLIEAKQNAGSLAEVITFQQMDAQNLEFPEGTFDVVLSRNLTWVLADPKQAYASWNRVLKPGGLLLNFDANWYEHLFDEEKREEYERDRQQVEKAGMEDHYTCTDIDSMEAIARKVPLSQIHRPAWDVEILQNMKMEPVQTDTKIWQSVWSPVEKVNYGSTPMFLVAAQKGEPEVKDYVEDYWTRRADGFYDLREAELHSNKYQRWEQEILSQLPEGESLKILDVGCGCGFFGIILARHGHQVTGIDLTPSMIERGKELAREQGCELNLQVMDAEHLDFLDGTFDVVISRNLTWTLPHPRRAYEEWMRVLKSGGLLLNFDAEYARNHHGKRAEDYADKEIGKELEEDCHKIYHMLDISGYCRPAWDRNCLEHIGMQDVEVDPLVGARIYVEKDRFYIPNPMFRVKAWKE